jgi:hypothetical protein
MYSRDTFSVIRAWQNADYVNEYYSQVYAYSDTTIVINGETIQLPAYMQLNIKIQSISASTPGNVYLLGNKIDVYNGSPNLGSVNL